MKTLFQVMGWGGMNVLMKTENDVVIEINTPPHGLLAKDNWNYLAHTIEGYLWNINDQLRLQSLSETSRALKIGYTA